MPNNTECYPKEVVLTAATKEELLDKLSKALANGQFQNTRGHYTLRVSTNQMSPQALEAWHHRPQ